jgi:hypothetical protein
LELSEIADLFEKAWKIMESHMGTLQTGDYGGKEFPDWLQDLGVQEQIDPMNKIIWDYCKKAGDLGLLQSWAIYARKYPERCVIAEA